MLSDRFGEIGSLFTCTKQLPAPSRNNVNVHLLIFMHKSFWKENFLSTATKHHAKVRKHAKNQVSHSLFQDEKLHKAPNATSTCLVPLSELWNEHTREARKIFSNRVYWICVINFLRINRQNVAAKRRKKKFHSLFVNIFISR